MVLPKELEKDEMIHQIEARKEPVLEIVKLMKKRLVNINDYYLREIPKLSKKDYFFETWMLINWIGEEVSPKTILEIGTRNGGSLISLLRPYKDYEGVKVVSFDIWREIGSPKKVVSNLEHVGIPTEIVDFHSGDSTINVPNYVAKNPGVLFDYILVDGGHEHETADKDLKNVENLVAPGGILVFDDLISYDLIHEWEAFKKRNGDKFTYYEVMHRKGIAWAFRN